MSQITYYLFLRKAATECNYATEDFMVLDVAVMDLFTDDLVDWLRCFAKDRGWEASASHNTPARDY